MVASSPARPTSWRLVVALAVLLVLVVTCVAALLTRDQMRANQEERLAYESAQLDVALAERMKAYVQILRGGVGLFEASEQVSRDEWLHYVETLRLDERYPGFKSLSFAPAVPEDELAAFVEEVRRERVDPDTFDPALIREFTPRSPTGVPGATEIHSPILFVAPNTPENQAVLGVDMMQDPTRRAVMLAAAESGGVQLSPRLRLATQPDQRAGFIAYLPVEVDGELRGWLTAAFRADDFMSGLHGDFATTIEYEISDGDGGLLYSTAAPTAAGAPRPLTVTADLARTSEVAMPGRSWDVRYVPNDDFATDTEKAAVWLVLGGGLLITLLVGAVGVTGGGWRGRAHQIEAQRAALAEREAVIRHQATHDPLTGLANRAHFLDRLSAALASGGAGLVYIDIDGFKPVNDRFGHRAGDELLTAIAERLTAGARPGDTVARLGGDEFAVVLASGPYDAVTLGADLVDRIGRPFEITVDGLPHPVVVGASVGIARAPDDAVDADGLVHAADTAMFRAKRDGGHRVVLAALSEPSRVGPAHDSDGATRE